MLHLKKRLSFPNDHDRIDDVTETDPNVVVRMGARPGYIRVVRSSDLVVPLSESQEVPLDLIVRLQPTIFFQKSVEAINHTSQPLDVLVVIRPGILE